MVMQAGFGHEYNSVTQDIPAYDHMLRVLPRCFTEVMLRLANPLRPLAPRMFKGGLKGGPHAKGVHVSAHGTQGSRL